MHQLKETYCGTFAAEFMDIRDSDQRSWLLEQLEPAGQTSLRQRDISSPVTIEDSTISGNSTLDAQQIPS